MTQSLESPSGLGRYGPLAKELAQLGHDVSILALHPDFAALKQRRFARDKVQVSYVGQMHVRKTGSAKRYFSPARLLGVAALATWQLTRAALRTPSDVYHLGKPQPMNSLAACLAGRLKGKPLYLDCDDYEAASNRFGGAWQRRVVAFFEDHTPAFTAGITVNTRFTHERLETLGYPGNRIVYVPNGVDRRRFSDARDDAVESLRRQLGLEGRQVVLYAGSLSLASHAVDLALQAFALARKAEPRAILLVAGGGEDYDKLQAQAARLGLNENVVRFVGRVPPEELPLYYRLADVSLDPVRDDPASRARSPLKLFESWAAGTPFVSAGVGDRPELLGEPPAGLLAAPGDAASLAETILAVLRDPELAHELRRRGGERVQAFYWERLVQDFAHVYECE
ncbi:MAG: glycosyltransferase family 4 protein [Thermoflexales bacterium]|nr:glycosyltransferase family 4 protein [Thermoflexales bacterium]